MLSQINFIPGDIVAVFEKIKEGDKTRLQRFTGKVIAVKGRGENKSFTVHKIVGDVGVEKIWPFNSPNVDRIEVREHSKKRIRRAKLYYERLPRVNP